MGSQCADSRGTGKTKEFQPPVRHDWGGYPGSRWVNRSASGIKCRAKDKDFVFIRVYLAIKTMEANEICLESMETGDQGEKRTKEGTLGPAQQMGDTEKGSHEKASTEIGGNVEEESRDYGRQLCAIKRELEWVSTNPLPAPVLK